PATPLIDLTHAIAPQNVRQAAFVLWTAYRYFPADTVFLVVVDPGVGSARHPVAVDTAQGRFVGPDNGVFSEVLTELGAWRAVAIEPERLGLPEPSGTFHGRDVFAPAAARLACGDPIAALGSPVEKLVMLEPPRLVLTHHTIEGEVIYVDHFGNAVTSIGRCFWHQEGLIRLQPRLKPDAPSIVFPAAAVVRAGSRTFQGIARTYTQVPPGQPTPLINSAAQLEIAVNQGNAQQTLGLAVGERVVVEIAT
ncbi:MAG: SAM-dependent chlorinase/fluorinase, partial [Nitrososphaerales archaeon]|nr:SAM-dependent chlorinase/fluorinase [Nitrososphaerales archaeon]